VPSERPDPRALLGVAADAPLDVCARAFTTRFEALKPRLVAAHAEERTDALEAWAILTAAWQAVAADPPGGPPSR
jgi:hypothetical protein